MKLGLIRDETIIEEIPLVDVKFTHSLCIGQTGSGKTTSFIYPNLLERMKLNHGILIFDIKGNEHLAVKSLAKEAGRLDDVLEIGKPWGRNLNILKELNETTVNELLKSIIGAGNNGGSNAYFYNAAQTLGLNIYSVLKTISILIQEWGELGIEVDFLDKKEFSLEDIYRSSMGIEELYKFLKNVDSFNKDMTNKISENRYSYFGKNHNIFRNLILNKVSLDKNFEKLRPYFYDEDARKDNGNFDRSLISVITTLNDSLGFMSNQSSKYIASSDNPLNIVDALQDNKIIVINVRVIPDKILEILLEQVFEQLIDLNIKDEDQRHPTSIFIDEAQRLITKEIPLDVLRSSKVDVVLAVQNETQLISKFGSREDWQQISINIAQKYSFRSSLFTNESNSFYPDTAQFNTFDFAKEFDNKIYRAMPKFMDKNELIQTEYEYQKNVLKIKELDENEYLIYDVTHYEKEREIIVKNKETNKKYYKKLFNYIEELLIDKYITDNLYSITYEGYIQEQINKNIVKDIWNLLIENFGIVNKKIYEESILKKGTEPSEFGISFDIPHNIYYNLESIKSLNKKYLKENKLSSKNYFLVYSSTDEIILFKKLPKKKLIEYGYEKYLEYKNTKNAEKMVDIK